MWVESPTVRLRLAQATEGSHPPATSVASTGTGAPLLTDASYVPGGVPCASLNSHNYTARNLSSPFQ